MESVSIIIPSYNHVAFLPRAIESSLQAGSAVREVIVVDDASADGSLAIAESWQARDPRVRLLRNETNAGVVQSVRRGLAAAAGQNLLFRAADDVSLPGFVDTAARLLDENPSAAFCLGDTRFFGESEERGRTQPAGNSEHATFVTPARWNEDFGGNELSVCSAIIRRTALKQIGGFDPELRWVSDWAVLAELGARGGFVYLPKPACAMRMSAGSYNSTGTLDDERQRAIFTRLLTRWADIDEPTFTNLRNAGILDFFATALRRLAPALRADLPSRGLELLAGIDQPAPASRSGCGMRAALREFLQEYSSTLQRFQSIALFGAGGHSELLLDLWSETTLSQPRLILTSTEPNTPSFRGLPVKAIHEATRSDCDAIVISSKSYEPDLARLAAAHIPDLPILRIWT